MNIILKLKEHYNLILLSDHVKEWVKYILNNNIELNIFEHKYFSYELGKLKSDEGTFKNVLEDLEIKAEETLFIDDSEKNINIAKQSRINVLQFTNANKLEEDLKSMEIY
jgi:putative hydrolase of the HAD superfamily